MLSLSDIDVRRLIICIFLIAGGVFSHQNTVVYNSGGLAYAKEGIYDLTIADYSKTLEIDPRDAIAYNNRGLTYTKKGDYDLAIADYNKALEINPLYAIAYNNRGNAYAYKSDYDLAIADYSKALEINPRYAVAYNNRGAAWYKKGYYDLAIVDYTKVLEINPRDAIAYNIRGNAYVKKGDYDLAVADYNNALEINPKNAVAYNNRGLAYVKKGDYDIAIADYNKALEINPKDTIAYNNRRLAYDYKGVHNSAFSNKITSSVTNKIPTKAGFKESVSISQKPKDKKLVDANTGRTKPIDSSPAVSEIPAKSVDNKMPQDQQLNSFRPSGQTAAKTAPDIEKESTQDASPQETAFQQEVSGKSAQDTEAERVSYPYSIQLASFETSNDAESALTFYKKTGLSPYWVKVNLGDKGIWFVLYTNYFKDTQKAQKIIKKYGLKEALVRNTKYAPLIGIYSSKEVLDAKILSIKQYGYSPYVIKGNNDKFYLYAGAFLTKAGVKNKCSELISYGIQCQAVER